MSAPPQVVRAEPKFRRMTAAEAIERARQREPFLVEDLVCSTLTLFYGPPESGKSTLATLLIASALTGEPFLDRPLTRTRTPGQIVLITTEVDGPEEYGRRLAERLGERAFDDRLGIYPVGGLSPNDWRELQEEICPAEDTLVVVDNLTEVLSTGSINDDEAVRVAFAGLRLFTARGSTSVLIGHSSEKAGPNGGRSTKPMGSTAISAAVRWKVRLEPKGSDRIELDCAGNSGRGAKITLERGEKETDLRVVEVSERQTHKRNENEAAWLGEIADWVVENCQGVSKADVARTLAEKFPELSPGSQNPDRTIASQLSKGAKLGGFLDYDKDSLTWTRK